VERETAVARKRVEDTETAIKQEQDDMRNAEKAGLTTTTPETTFEEMVNVIGDSLSNLSSSDDGEDGKDEDDGEEDPVGGKFSEYDEPGWVMGTISETVQHRMEWFRQKQMNLVELMKPGWGDAASYFREGDKRYGTTGLKVPDVIQPLMADNTASSALMTFSDPMETLDSVPGKLQMPQVTSQPRSCLMRQGSSKPWTHERIPSLPAAPIPDWSLIQKSKHDEPVSYNPCTSHAKLITIPKLDFNEDMVTAPVLPEEWIGKLVFGMMYQLEMQYVSLCSYGSAFTWLQWSNCETWYFVYTYAMVRSAMPKF